MLKIVVGTEALDEKTNEIVLIDTFTLRLEHSLVSLSKWESIWEKPFLSTPDKSPEMMYSYIECMILNEDYPPEILHKLTKANVQSISDYMSSKQSATWFSEAKPEPKSKEVVTSELIYYWLDALQIPDHPIETWHLSRLFNRIKIHSIKNAKPKKMSRAELARRNRELNERRLREMGTSG